MGDDDNTRISQLAKNLKDLHLAASSEEAFARAKEIILGTSSHGNEKSIKEMMQEAGVTQHDLEKAKALLKEEEKALKELKDELTELKAKQIEEGMQHSEHSAETEKLDSEIAQDEHDVGLVEENIDVAEEVQKDED